MIGRGTLRYSGVTREEEMDPREEKLPKWAKHLLATERQKRAVAERKLAEHLETIEPSRIWWGDYDNPIYIPPHYGYQTVHFQLGDQGMHTEVSARLKDDALEIGGGHGLTIDMEVSNRFRVRFRD
ncbi:hypothetical protein SEA_POOMPHA_64 [Mycobacterium phage Poompha]|nr:hypothetical protein SEA_POOMPHA_64 [Mycobacterium phage Poompha]